MRSTLVQATAISIALVGCTAISGVGDLRSRPEHTDAKLDDDIPAQATEGGAPGSVDEAGGPSGGPDGSTPTLAVGDVRLFAGSPDNVVSSRTRRAGTTAWSPAVMELTLDGSPRFMVPFLHTRTIEENLAVQYETDAGSIVEVRRRTASDWAVDVTTPPMPKAHAAKRTFAVATEAASGDDLLVYAKAGSGVPVYRTRTATGWSAETAVPLGGATAGSVIWVDLAAHPRSDELTLAFSTTSSSLYVQTWDGDAWSMPSFAGLEGDLNSTEFSSFALAYEAMSGDVVIAWGREHVSGGPYITGWATRVSGSPTFGPVQTLDGATPSGPMHAAADPGSDRVAFVWEEDTCGTSGVCDDFVAAVWTGSSFVAVGTLDGNVGATFKTRKGSMPIGAGWFEGSAVGVFASTNPTTDGLRWTRWSGSGSWATPEIAPMSPALGDQVSYATLSLPSQVLVVVADLDHIWAKSYGSAGWANADDGAPLFDFGVAGGVPFGLLTR